LVIVMTGCALENRGLILAWTGTFQASTDPDECWKLSNLLWNWCHELFQWR